jgi:hypothetical protein
VIASEVLAGGKRFIRFNPSANGDPSVCEGSARAGHFKIVHIDHEEELPLAMPKAGSPVGYGFESYLFEMAFAMLFPIPPCVRVPIEREA